MPKIRLDIDTNVKQVSNDFNTMATNVNKVDKNLKNTGTTAKSLGTNLSTAFKGFLIGGAIQKGVSSVIDLLARGNENAKALADSIRTLRFLGDEEEISSNKRLQKRLAAFGIAATRVGATQAEVLSTAGGLDVGTREQILASAGAAEAGGVGEFRSFAAATSQIALGNARFQTPAGITEVGNLLTQGITEAKLDPSQIGVLSDAILAGRGAGLSEAESIAQFAGLTTLTSTKDEAKERFKQISLLYLKSGAKEKGLSFNGWIKAVASTPFEKLDPAIQTLYPTIVGMANQMAETEKKTSRTKAAQFGGTSLTLKAFEKQAADPQTAINIIEAEEEALEAQIGPTAEERRATGISQRGFEQGALTAGAVAADAVNTFIRILDAAVQGRRISDEGLPELETFSRQSRARADIKGETIEKLQKQMANQLQKTATVNKATTRTNL